MSGERSSGSFSARVLAWYHRSGRKDLPWQINPTPYRVWVSEIMLQQTQVGTVIPYYERFMARFPDVAALASASLDEVLHHWSGLGYYARGRNLHRAAEQIHARYRGGFPLEIAAVQDLPGVGRSTAGAILALADGQCHPILDGNVKRVLARFHAVEGWPGLPKVADRLWGFAERYTPRHQVAAYTQAIMDLGATVCTRASPVCGACPLETDCAAHRAGRERAFPSPKPRQALPERATRLLMLCRAGGEVLLVRRPPTGVWGGLWGFPEVPEGAPVADWCRERLGCEVSEHQPWPVLKHTFTHFRLHITPIYARVRGVGARVMEGPDTLWYNTDQRLGRGLPAPVRRLLDQLHRNLTGDSHGTDGEMRETG
ncbi:MAG: A/G-specific adenine glycosylase [Chromatiales bacterium 21-64-14]|nr:MAG: A/G-specific adenine glycosylase [Chromatiales bacterium 21-64-14]HQU17280.1 A/G-specific adenine glycosylase [Gammaproteobacteria bacterium]